MRVAVVGYPFGSNLDELHLLPTAAKVRWASTPGDLDDVDLVILPGSKHVAADVEWLRRRGLADRIVALAGSGTLVLGICGGAMMLGVRIEGVGSTQGLDLLPISTEMVPEKLTASATVKVVGYPVPGAD